MSFLQTLKEALQSRIGQTVVGELPEIVSATAEIAANPSNAVHVLAELVETELAKLAGRIEEVDVAPAHGLTDEAVTALAEQIFAALEPKLKPYAAILDLVAQHFPHLQVAESKPVA